MSEKSDIEVVQNFMKCTPEKAQDMIDKGINVDYLRNSGEGLFTESIEEAKLRFLDKIMSIKTEMDAND
jgi:hypothetical protein